ncbi:PRADC1-like protein isoform X2 [Cephus cinctus]|uniref:PRADC1-like protein isoform X2 n=1 Tax=Cephus cinctus TaxID=211228 RepID=A0AAJ7FNT4_CEPCN|nr:PRADC1-like protein isoform X2 [Cephus cinctus]
MTPNIYGNKLRDWRTSESILEIRDSDVFFEIIDPPELEYTYRLWPAMDFGAPFNTSFSERGIPLVLSNPATGCRRPDNADQLKGRVALVQRGECTFLAKAAIGQNAGAKAVIITDYYAASAEEERTNPLWMDHYYIDMTHDNNINLLEPVRIPVGFLLGKNGKMICKTLRKLDKPFALINIPVNLTYTPINKLQQPPWLSW